MPTASPASHFNSVRTHIEQLEGERVHPVFILDEVQMLEDEVLCHLHVLGNFDWDRKSLLSLILVGLPELRHRLDTPKHRFLYSRLDCRVHVPNPSADDTVEYVQHRVTQVDGSAHLLASDAMTLWHEAAQGRLRDIGQLATAATQEAVARKVSIVDRAIFEAVLVREEGGPIL